MLWSDVALAGHHIDDNIEELSLIPIDTPLSSDPRRQRLNTESFYMHGLDLGLTFNY